MIVQAVELEDGAAFRWQNSVYRVVKQILLDDNSIDTVMVQCVAEQWTKDVWRTVVGRQVERFNPYCEVDSGTIGLAITSIEKE